MPVLGQSSESSNNPFSPKEVQLLKMLLKQQSAGFGIGDYHSGGNSNFSGLTSSISTPTTPAQSPSPVTQSPSPQIGGYDNGNNRGGSDIGRIDDTPTLPNRGNQRREWANDVDVDFGIGGRRWDDRIDDTPTLPNRDNQRREWANDVDVDFGIGGRRWDDRIDDTPTLPNRGNRGVIEDYNVNTPRNIELFKQAMQQGQY